MDKTSVGCVAFIVFLFFLAFAGIGFLFARAGASHVFLECRPGHYYPTQHHITSKTPRHTSPPPI